MRIKNDKIVLKTNDEYNSIYKYFHLFSTYESGDREINGFINNGRKDSTWIEFLDKDTAAFQNFKDGELNNIQRIYSNRLVKYPLHPFAHGYDDNNGCFKDNGEQDKLYLSETIFYDNGQAIGPMIKYYSNGKIKEKVLCINGKKEGKGTRYSYDGKYKEVCYYKNGELNEEKRLFFNDTLLKYEYYNQGRLEGEYLSLNNQFDTVAYGNFKYGYNIGKWLYFKSKSLFEVSDFNLSDSCFQKHPTGDGLNYRSYRVSKNSTYFYPNGEKSMEGRQEKGKRVDVWKFYDEAGNLIKEINYKDTTIKVGWRTDSIESKGTYKEWYFNGQLKAEGYVINESSKFDCNQRLNLKLQDVVYKEFYDYNGNHLIKNGVGRMENIHSNFKISEIGSVKEGVQDGKWEYFTPDGNLTEIGVYKMGKKDGKWFSGDLKGISFVEDACFNYENKDQVEAYKKEQEKRLNITELYYKNGELIKSINYFQDLNKK